MNHYVYRITNKITKLHYYGKRSCVCDPKLDLGIKYFSSSKDKAFILDQKMNTSSYKYKIIKKFSTSEEAIEYEIKLHNKFNVGINPKFYNRAKQTALKFSTVGKAVVKDFQGNNLQVDVNDPRINTKELIGVNNGFHHSEKTKTQLSIAHTGKTFTEEHRRNLSIARKGKKVNTAKASLDALNAYRHLAYTEEARAKISAKLKGRNLTEEHRQKISNSQKGIPKPCMKTVKQLKEHAIKISKPVIIYNATTNEVIATNVVITTWAKEHGYEASSLNRTTRRDLSKPKSKENLYTYKNMYAVHISKDLNETGKTT